MSVVEEHEDILQNIEAAIVSVYRDDSDLPDTVVIRALEAAIAHYHADQRGHALPPVKLSGNALLVFERIREVCEMCLGRGSLSAKADALFPATGQATAEILVACLRRIRKSVDRWNKQAGRRGYFQFVSQFTR